MFRPCSKSFVFGLALASSLAASARASTFAETVLSYSPGAGATFTNAQAALGEPSRATSGPFGGPVDPFNPPFLKDQIVSVGAGGSLTVRLGAPAFNDPRNPFGLDFLIFGNAGFVITNNDFSGGGKTDGSLFGANPGATRVSVSPDSINYFQLTPALAPTVDTYYPTDGSGDFSLPVNPKLKGSDFSGRDLVGLRALYGGAGGGAGFDISWAQDASGHSVSLDHIQFIRIDVSSGTSEIDGFAVVPEPSANLLLLTGGLLVVLGAFRRRRKQSASQP